MPHEKHRARVLSAALVLIALFASSCANVRLFNTNTPAPDMNALVKAKFVRASDGDTAIFEVNGAQITVRLLGIDAPEIGTLYAITSKNYLESALEGQTVYLENDAEPFDAYARSLYYIWTADGALLNASIVRDGAAIASIHPPNTKYAKLLTEAQLVALEKGGGLWASYKDWSLGTDDDSRYAGNVNSKTLHRLNCSILPSERNRVYFNSHSAGIKAGYKECSNCFGYAGG